jgi:hypothetical protein
VINRFKIAAGVLALVAILAAETVYIYAAFLGAL